MVKKDTSAVVVGTPQDELNLFLVKEMERLSLLIERLKERGVVTDADFLVTSLDAQARDLRRRIKVAKKGGDEKLVEQLRASLRDTEKRLAALE